MRLAKVAVASVSPTVGAVSANVSRLIALAREMAAAEGVVIEARRELCLAALDLRGDPGLAVLEASTGDLRATFEPAAAGRSSTSGGRLRPAATAARPGRTWSTTPR